MVAWARTYLDIEEAFSEDRRSLIDGLALTIKLATEHFGGDGHLEHVTGELTMSVGVVNVGSTLKDLSYKIAEKLDAAFM